MRPPGEPPVNWVQARSESQSRAGSSHPSCRKGGVARLLLASVLYLMPEDAALHKLCGFEPSAERVVALDQRVRSRLADSLDKLSRAVSPHLPINLPALGELSAVVRRQPVSSAVMALYTDSVEALFSEDETLTLSLLNELSDKRWLAPATPRIVTLRDEDLGPGQSDRFARIVNDDPIDQIRISPVSVEAFTTAHQSVLAARALCAEAIPDLGAEIDTLAREIILVDPRSDSDLIFHGSSSFYLWGAVFLNAGVHHARIKAAEGLIHETGHSLLFGLNLGAPLVTNDAEERYPSPLRSDLRPMDGIVHATYVLARMFYGLVHLESSNCLERSEREEAQKLMAFVRSGFVDGIAVVDAHARFTPEGEASFVGARDYMKQSLN